MKHIILVHGAWHGAWCWKELLKKLPKGLSIETPDLSEIKHHQPNPHFKDYLDRIKTSIEASAHPVTLVGHSFAGFLISQLACQLSHKIEELIYLNAFIPIQGESLISLSEQLTSRHLSPYLTIDENKNTIHISPLSILQQYMYNCFDNAHLIIDKLKAEPLQPFNHPVDINTAFKSIAKRAIICKNDLTLNEKDQRFMCDRQDIPFQLMDGDHCPFYSNPDILAKLLIQTPEDTYARRNTEKFWSTTDSRVSQLLERPS